MSNDADLNGVDGPQDGPSGAPADDLEALLGDDLERWKHFDLSELPEPEEATIAPEPTATEPAAAAEAALAESEPPEEGAPATTGAAVAPADLDPDASAAGPADDPPPGREVDATRLAWNASLVLLGAITLIAAVVLVVTLGPAVVGGVGDAASAVSDAASDGAAEVSGAWDRWSGKLEAIAVAAAAPEEIVVEAPEGSASLLMVVVGDEDRGRAFALVARGPDGTSTVMLAPPGLRGVLPGYGDFPLADAPLFEDSRLASLALANQLGIRIDGVLTFGPGDLSEALAAPIELDLPVPLIVGEGDEGRVLAKSGRAERSPAVMETVITTRGISDELEWLQRQGAAWVAILDAAAADPALADRLAEFADAPGLNAAALLAAVGADGDRNVTAVPVTRVAVGGPDAGFALNTEAADPFVAQRLGHLLLRDGARPRVEVLNGNGRVGTTRVVAQQLVRRGYRVVRTDNADAFDYEATQVVAHGRTNRTEAEAVLRLIGSGELLLELRNPSGVVDISIIVGRDVPAGEG